MGEREGREAGGERGDHSLFKPLPHLHTTTPLPKLSSFLPPVKRGDRVAQLILERIITPDVEEVEDLDDTARGAGGYGSTGVASK